MRWWKNKIYRDYEWRCVKRFLWLPKCLPISSLPVDDLQWRWLETTKISQQYLNKEWHDLYWYQS
jgi:hypothetical protein